MGERENHIATGKNLNHEDKLLQHHHEEEAMSMEMNPRALPRPGRVPSQEFWSLEACWRWRRRSELLLDKRVLESGFSRREYKYGPKGGTGGGPSRPGGHPARVDPWPRQEGARGL